MREAVIDEVSWNLDWVNSLGWEDFLAQTLQYYYLDRSEESRIETLKIVYGYGRGFTGQPEEP